MLTLKFLFISINLKTHALGINAILNYGAFSIFN